MVITYQTDLFADFFNNFLNKIATKNGIIKYYLIGKWILKVTYCQKNYNYFGEAIAHLEVDSSKEDFSICVISHIDTAIVPPNAFWGEELIGTNGVFYSADERYVAHYNSINNYFQIANNINNTAIYWLQNEELIPDYERSFSFRWILHHFTEKTDFCMLHAAGLGNTKGGFILPAKSGSGKSNTSLACIGSNIKYLGDDFILVDSVNLIAYNLYNCAKIEPRRIRYFKKISSVLNDNLTKYNSEKAHIYLYPQFKSSLINSFKIKAILIPQFTGNLTTIISKASAADSLIAMAPTTIGVLKASKLSFQKMAKITKNLPAFSIKTGSNLSEIPAKINLLLNSI